MAAASASGTSPPGGSNKESATRPGNATLAGKPTLIQWNKLRFLVMDSPRVRVQTGPVYVPADGDLLIDGDEVLAD